MLTDWGASSVAENEHIAETPFQATQEYIDWLENDKRRTARPADDEAQHQREQGAMQKISAILGDRQGDPSAIEAAGDFLASLEPEVAKCGVGLESFVRNSTDDQGMN